MLIFHFLNVGHVQKQQDVNASVVASAQVVLTVLPSTIHACSQGNDACGCANVLSSMSSDMSADAAHQAEAKDEVMRRHIMQMRCGPAPNRGAQLHPIGCCRFLALCFFGRMMEVVANISREEALLEEPPIASSGYADCVYSAFALRADAESSRTPPCASCFVCGCSSRTTPSL